MFYARSISNLVFLVASISQLELRAAGESPRSFAHIPQNLDSTDLRLYEDNQAAACFFNAIMSSTLRIIKAS